ncbi:hypothetical protein [Pandoraea anhela]|nr:hypothetical protein [Pandoraea anhela]
MEIDIGITSSLQKVQQLQARHADLMRRLESRADSAPALPESEPCARFTCDMARCEPMATPQPDVASPPGESPLSPNLSTLAARKILGDKNANGDDKQDTLANGTEP